MCEKRIRKIKRGSLVMRDARRVQRIQRLASPTTNSDSNTVRRPCPPSTEEKIAQNKAIVELAWKTIILMQRNRLIQQKIIALKKETSEFIAIVMNNPENKKRYLENIRLNEISNGVIKRTENETLLKIDPPRV